MDILTLQQPELVSQLEQAAAEREETPEQLLNLAVSEFLEKINRQKIHLESRAFESIHGELIKKHLGQYIAFHDGRVVDQDKDARTLYLRVRKKFGNTPILIRQVTKQAKNELVFRTPRFSKVQP